MMHDGVFGIARREKDLEPRASHLGLDRELTAVHASGHDHIGEQQIDAFRTIDNRQRLGGIAGGQCVVTKTADLRHDVFADQRVVLDNQDGLIAAFEFGDASLGGQSVRDARGLRQIKLHGGAVALFAVDPDMSVRLFDEAVDHAETEPRSLSDLLGGEERFKHLVEQAAGDSCPGVAHRNHDIVARINLAAHGGVVLVEHDILGFQRQLATVRHSVPRIQGEVQDRRRELTGIDQGRRGIVRQHRFDFDLFAEGRS